MIPGGPVHTFPTSTIRRVLFGIHRNVSVPSLEHVVPVSWYSDSMKMKKDARRDMHNLMVMPLYENCLRQNYAYSTREAYPYAQWELIGDRSYRCRHLSLFEPAPEERGQISRKIMYFYSVYGIWNLRPGRRLITSDMLRQWHMKYPVTAEEYEENEIIAEWQGNYNPFVKRSGICLKRDCS